jgi:hypothetical protein
MSSASSWANPSCAGGVPHAETPNRKIALSRIVCVVLMSFPPFKDQPSKIVRMIVRAAPIFRSEVTSTSPVQSLHQDRANTIPGISIMVRANHPPRGEIDVYIEPRIAGFSFTSLKEVDALFECGRGAAEKALPTLRRRFGIG